MLSLGIKNVRRWRLKAGFPSEVAWLKVGLRMTARDEFEMFEVMVYTGRKALVYMMGDVDRLKANLLGIDRRLIGV